MKSRLAFLAKLYALLLLTVVLQKPLFMWLDAPEGSHYGLGDAVDVIINGLELDIPVTGYLIALPLLFVLFTCWTGKSLPLRKIAVPYYVLVAVAVCSAFVIDTSLYPFWKFKLDATIFYYIDSPKDAMASVSTLYIIGRVAATIVYSTIVAWLMAKATPLRLEPMPTNKRLLCTLILVAITGPLAISIRGGIEESTANIGKVYFSDDEYLNHAAVNPCFSMIASLSKAGNYADEFNFFPEDKRARLFDGLYPDTSNDTISLLNTRRPNIIIILMEGFGGQFVEAVSGHKDITPCYNRLAHEGILFTNCYSNSFRTDRGTVSALSGYAAFPTLSVMKLPIKSRTLPCIAASLNAEGYKSSFLYGGDINFTNMQSYLRTGGYSDIVSDADFKASEKQNAWGVNDDITFEYLLAMAKQQKHTPWHIGYLTLSSHEPFEVPYQRLKEKIPNAFAFTDHCLGRFVEKMKTQPEWKDLLIVCIPDHGFPYPQDISYEGHHHNTMLWIGGAVKRPMVVETLMNQSDMAATLLGQLRIDHSQYNTFSRDVFSNSYTYPFAFFTAKQNFGIIDSTGFTVYDIVGNKALENHDNKPNGQQRRIDKAKAIMQSFYDDLGSR